MAAKKQPAKEKPRGKAASKTPARLPAKATRPEDAPLTPFQKRFTEEYPVDLNITKAAIRAGYAPAYANRQGSAIMRLPNVQKAIAEELEARSQRTNVTKDMVVRELAKIAFQEMGDVASWTEEGLQFVPSDQLTPEQRALIASVKSKRRTIKMSEGDEDGIIETVDLEIKTWDKVAALEKLARHLGMFEERFNKGEPLTIRVVTDAGR